MDKALVLKGIEVSVNVIEEEGTPYTKKRPGDEVTLTIRMQNVPLRDIDHKMLVPKELSIPSIYPCEGSEVEYSQAVYAARSSELVKSMERFGLKAVTREDIDKLNTLSERLKKALDIPDDTASHLFFDASNGYHVRMVYERCTKSYSFHRTVGGLRVAHWNGDEYQKFEKLCLEEFRELSLRDLPHDL